MMRPSLILHPIHNSSADIIRTITRGEPLTAEQLDFLDWHQQALSAGFYDPIQDYLNENKAHPSFLIPSEVVNAETIELLKYRIEIVLKNNAHPYINLTPEQYLAFRKYTIQELIFWRGNQFLTGAPFYPGGVPPVLFFQWGNLFGIVKQVVLSGEKALKGNLLIYFQDLQERTLEQCIKAYQDKLENEIKLQNQLVLQQREAEKLIPTLTPRLLPTNYFLVKT